MWSSRVGKLQEVEGIIKGMLMTLDIRLGTRLVDWPPESPDNQYHLNK